MQMKGENYKSIRCVCVCVCVCISMCVRGRGGLGKKAFFVTKKAARFFFGLYRPHVNVIKLS